MTSRLRFPLPLFTLAAVLAAGPPALAQTPALDVENRRVVTGGRFPNEILTADALVVGGGLGGVAAAEALARQGLSVILTEPTSMLGGQLTAQAVPVPDENRFIETDPGIGTRAYRELRQAVRDHYAAEPGLRPNRSQHVGMAWVSRVSGLPAVWEAQIEQRLEALSGAGGIRRILTRTQLLSVQRNPHSRQYHFADFVHLDTGRITRVAAHFMLDATELGDGIALAGLPWVVGAEPRSAHGEPDAPLEPRPDWIQSFTYCFLVRWQPEPPHTIVEKPEEYEYFKSLGEYTLDYDYSHPEPRTVTYQVFGFVPGSGGPFWTYRRLIAASSFEGRPEYAHDIVLINWRGNDFNLENPVGKSPEEQARILERGKRFAQGFLYWLQTECPRDDGGFGYPEMQLAPELIGTEDGFAAHPYVRESRRVLAEFTLNQNHLPPPDENDPRATGEKFFDRVGIALYALDIHPAHGEPAFLQPALPYYLPLGAFIPLSETKNVLPAAKNFGATRLALSSARMHPTEWLVGEVAGHLAAFCLRRGVLPIQVRNDPQLLAEFQDLLRRDGHPLDWEPILGPAGGPGP